MNTIANILDCEKYLGEIDAVIFDLDDTLYGEKDYVRSGYAAVAKAFPVVTNMERKLWKAFENKLPAIDYVFEEEGICIPDVRKKALDIYRNHLPQIELYPGVEALLTRLAQTKKLGLITDGRPEGQWAKIEALNISQYFDKIIVTDELGGVEFRKPNKRAFTIMKNDLNVPYARMIYIGDNVKKDFIAPNKLGMKSVWFQNSDGLY